MDLMASGAFGRGGGVGPSSGVYRFCVLHGVLGGVLQSLFAQCGFRRFESAQGGINGTLLFCALTRGQRTQDGLSIVRNA